jgi:hypothetical protein
MRIRSKLLGVATVSASLITIVSLASGRVSAASPHCTVDVPAFGMVGIASGQTARLNVFLPATDSQGVQYPPGSPVRIQLSLVNAAGDLAVASPCDPRSIDCLGGSQMSVTLAAGQSAFLDVSAEQLVGALGRAEIRPVVNVYPPGPPVAPANAIVATFELIDNSTNRTVIFDHPPSPCRANN